MDYEKGWGTASIQFQRMEVENAEDLVQWKNHVTENYAHVILFVVVLFPSLYKSLKYPADTLNVIRILFVYLES